MTLVRHGPHTRPTTCPSRGSRRSVRTRSAAARAFHGAPQCISEFLVDSVGFTLLLHRQAAGSTRPPRPPCPSTSSARRWPRFPPRRCSCRRRSPAGRPRSERTPPWEALDSPSSVNAPQHMPHVSTTGSTSSTRRSRSRPPPSSFGRPFRLASVPPLGLVKHALELVLALSSSGCCCSPDSTASCCAKAPHALAERHVAPAPEAEQHAPRHHHEHQEQVRDHQRRVRPCAPSHTRAHTLSTRSPAGF